MTPAEHRAGMSCGTLWPWCLITLAGGGQRRIGGPVAAINVGPPM